MKKFFLLSVIICSVVSAFAQFTTNLVISAQPPASLISWTQRDLNFIVINQSGAARQAKIKAELKTSDGTIVGTTNLVKARTVNIGFGNTAFSFEDVFSPVLMQFNGKVRTAIEKTGKLPADNYQLCVRLVTPTDYVPISEEKCRSFTVAALQLAIPVIPVNESWLKPEAAQSVITFRWTPVAPMQSLPVTYRLLVFEVLSGQTPMQSLRSNMPLLQKDVVGTTQYIWQPQLGLINAESRTANTGLDSAVTATVGKQSQGVDFGQRNSAGEKTKRTFIWTLQCLDSKGLPLGDGNVNGDGISEPIIFYVGKQPD